jgi:hypothetical protein
VQVLELGRLLRLVRLAAPHAALLGDDAGDAAVTRDELDALAAQHLRPPAADPAEVEEPLLVDVRHDQANLVDVADHGQERPAARAP